VAFPGSETLRYRLVQGCADVAPLRVLATERFVWRAWHVTAHVLGTSHALVLQQGEVALTELFTCAPAPDEPNPLLALEGVGAGEVQYGNLWAQVRVWQQVLGEPLPHAVLRVAFPVGLSGIAPVTQLHWEAHESLHLTSLHTYPEENTAVWTETRLTEITP